MKEIWHPARDAGERQERRQKGRRKEIIKELEAELGWFGKSGKAHPKRACQLLVSRCFSPYLKQLKSHG